MNPTENTMRVFQDEFRAEGLEHLENVEKELIFLEKQPDPERIAVIFRSVHSIKGAAGFMGFSRISELTHLMETLLQVKRQENTVPSREEIDALLSGVDTLKKLLKDPEKSNKADIGAISASISAMAESSRTEKTRRKQDTQVRLFDGQGDGIDFDVNEFKLDAVPVDSKHMYVVQFDLNELQKKEGITPHSLIRQLLGNGYVLDTKIEIGADDFGADLSEASLTYEVLFATHLGPEAVRNVSEFRSAVVIPVFRQESSGIEEKKAVSPDPACPEAPDESVGENEPAFADTVRIRVDILNKLMKLAGELVLVRNNLLVMTQSNHSYRGISQRLNLVTSEMQETIMQTRLQPIGNLFAKLPRIVRDLSLKLSKRIEIDTRGNEVELDKTILESLTDPMTHLIRNCCDHGIESSSERKASGKPSVGRIFVRAWHDAGHINIEIEDDGRGLDPESIRSRALESGLKTAEELSDMNEKDILSVILMSGFSTAESVSDISGRGVGMDVVRAGVERLGGVIGISSKKGRGTGINLRLPLTLAIIPCLLVKVGKERYAIPQTNLVELVCLRKEDVYTKIESTGDQEVYRLRNRLLPIVRLSEVLARREPFTSADRAGIGTVNERLNNAVLTGQKKPYAKALIFAVVKIGTKRYGLVVDEVIGVEEIVVNPVHSALKSLQIYAGTTIMGDGAVAMILDIDGIAKHADVQFNLREEEQAWQFVSDDEIQTVLIFKSGPQEQFAVPLQMIRRVEHIRASDIERVGDREFVTVYGIPNRVLRIDNVLNVSGCTDRKEMLLLLPKHVRRPFGILVSEVVDTFRTTLDLNTESHMEKGLLGTAVIGDHITLFLDVYHLIELAEPEWFAERRKKAPPPNVSKHLLLLEDTSFFRDLIKRYLESDGYVVTAVKNGRAGIAALGEQSFDMIVSDIDMPIMNGWAFMEYVRNESSVPDIPAMALTALDSEADRVRAEEVGFNAYQIKLDREELLTNVSKILRRFEQSAKEARS